MYDSLPYRNDAAIVLRRLVRSLPRAAGRDRHRHLRQGPAGDADGGRLVPRAARRDRARRRDAAAARTARTPAPCRRSAPASRTAWSTLQEAAELGCRACASPGGGCQFFGTAASAQVVAEALGLTVPHAALAPSGQPIWLDVARRTAQAVLRAARRRAARSTTCSRRRRSRTRCSLHAACGGSTNLLLHVPAIAHAAGLRASDGGGLAARQPLRAAPRRRAAQRPVEPRHGARVPGRRGARGDAAPARARPAAHGRPMITGQTWDEVLDEWEDSERRHGAARAAARDGRRRPRRRDLPAGAGAREGHDVDGVLPRGATSRRTAA